MALLPVVTLWLCYTWPSRWVLWASLSWWQKETSERLWGRMGSTQTNSPLLAGRRRGWCEEPGWLPGAEHSPAGSQQGSRDPRPMATRASKEAATPWAWNRFYPELCHERCHPPLVSPCDVLCRDTPRQTCDPQIWDVMWKVVVLRPNFGTVYWKSQKTNVAMGVSKAQFLTCLWRVAFLCFSTDLFHASVWASLSKSTVASELCLVPGKTSLTPRSWEITSYILHTLLWSLNPYCIRLLLSVWGKVGI